MRAWVVLVAVALLGAGCDAFGIAPIFLRAETSVYQARSAKRFPAVCMSTGDGRELEDASRRNMLKVMFLSDGTPTFSRHQCEEADSLL